MKWFACDDRHSSEVFRVFGVKFQLSPKPAETPTVQVRHITEQIHFAVFSNLFFKLSDRGHEQIVKPRAEDLAIKVHPIQRA
jgi:hypothetical protein